MAFIKNGYCHVCEAHQQFINGKCVECSERDRRTAMAAWISQTTEEKLLDLHKRLLKLEAGPPRY